MSSLPWCNRPPATGPQPVLPSPSSASPRHCWSRRRRSASCRRTSCCAHAHDLGVYSYNCDWRQRPDQGPLCPTLLIQVGHLGRSEKCQEQTITTSYPFREGLCGVSGTLYEKLYYGTERAIFQRNGSDRSGRGCKLDGQYLERGPLGKCPQHGSVKNRKEATSHGQTGAKAARNCINGSARIIDADGLKNPCQVRPVDGFWRRQRPCLHCQFCRLDRPATRQRVLRACNDDVRVVEERLDF